MSTKSSGYTIALVEDMHYDNMKLVLAGSTILVVGSNWKFNFDAIRIMLDYELFPRELSIKELTFI